MAALKNAVANKNILKLRTEEIWADNTRNFRHSWKYRVEPKASYDPAKDAPGFYESIVENGVQVNIEVAQLATDQVDAIERAFGIRPKYRVIRGHRRFKAVTLARENIPGMFDLLTCVVYTGLSEQEEIALMFDHNGVEPLDEFEVYKAIVSLYGTGKSQEKIAGLVGQNRQYVQDRIYMHELPIVIRAEFEKRFTPLADGKLPKKNVDYIYHPWSDVDKLHTRLNADVAAGVDPESAESQTMLYWAEIANKTKGSGNGPNVKSLSKKDMDARKGFIKGCDALEVAHAFYNGEGGSIENAASQYRALESQAALVPGLKSQVADLTDQVAGLTTLLDEKEAEILRLSALVPTNGHVGVNELVTVGTGA